MNKRILFEIAHPKHFHQFKYLIRSLSNKYEIKIIARDKDVVLELLEESGYSFIVYGLHGKTMFQKYLALPAILRKYWKIVSEFKPDLIISRSSPYAAIISKFSSTKVLVLPDSEVVTFNNRFVVPLSNYVITPDSYELDHGEYHYKVDGFFESAYLHPNYFAPDETVLRDLNLPDEETFYIIRLVGWFANHDTDRAGFTDSQKLELVEHLKKSGKVFISGEGELSKELKPYQLKINPGKMHSLLYYASMYIGDSQTMATEAALLGTPSVRYNSFVGEDDMSNFKILENKYELLSNVSHFEDVMKRADEITASRNVKNKYMKKRDRYFAKTGDVNQETRQIIIDLLEE